jgi:hypothetical protein
VFHPGQFYVHIFQLKDSHFQLHLYGLSLQYKFLDDFISVSGDARYNNRLESGVGKTPFQPATQSVYCISENETPNKDIICANIDNMLCDTAQLMRAKGRNVKCPNH